MILFGSLLLVAGLAAEVASLAVRARSDRRPSWSLWRRSSPSRAATVLDGVGLVFIAWGVGTLHPPLIAMAVAVVVLVGGPHLLVALRHNAVAKKNLRRAR